MYFKACFRVVLYKVDTKNIVTVSSDLFKAVNNCFVNDFQFIFGVVVPAPSSYMAV